MPFDNSNFHPTDPVLKCLQDARQRIENPANWHQGDWSNYRYGKAAAWCTWGSVFVVLGSSGEMHGRVMSYLNASTPDGRGAISYNDDPTTTHADVLALFDRAIAARLSELLASQSQVGS